MGTHGHLGVDIDSEIPNDKQQVKRVKYGFYFFVYVAYVYKVLKILFNVLLRSR